MKIMVNIDYFHFLFLIIKFKTEEIAFFSKLYQRSIVGLESELILCIFRQLDYSSQIMVIFHTL